MEFADGGDLQKYINERRSANNYLTQDEIVKLVANIALGLNELH
jgi:serine/threonine protein kinase